MRAFVTISKRIILANVACLTISLFACSKLNKLSTDFSNREHTIVEGMGFDNYKIDSTTIEEVIKNLGRRYKKTDHKDFCVEITYEKYGLTFCYDPKDSEKKIFSIEFYHPFRGITSRGIVLNKSTMLDVKNAYDSLDWYTTENSKYWVSEYSGIEFSVERDMSLPQYPLDEDLHAKKIITRIEIINDN